MDPIPFWLSLRFLKLAESAGPELVNAFEC
jgi:hypothetical protein